MMGWIIKLKTQISLIDVDSIDSMVILSTSDPSVTFGPLTFDPNFGQGETCNQSERMIGIASHWVSCWVPGFSCFLYTWLHFYGNPGAKGKQSTPDVLKVIQDYSRLFKKTINTFKIMLWVFISKVVHLWIWFSLHGLGHVWRDFPMRPEVGWQMFHWDSLNKGVRDGSKTSQTAFNRAWFHCFHRCPIGFTFPLRCSNGVPMQWCSMACSLVGAVPGTRGKPSEIWTLIKTAKWVGGGHQLGLRMDGTN